MPTVSSNGGMRAAVYKEVSVRATQNRPKKKSGRLVIAVITVVAIDILAASAPEFASGPVAEADRV